MKKNILAWCSLFMVNNLLAQDLRVHQIKIELDQIEALQGSLARRADFLRDQENLGERGGLAGAMPADRLDLDLQKRLEKLRDQQRNAINAAQVTGLTGAEIKQTQSTVDSIRFKQEAELKKNNIKKNFILIKDIQKNLPDAVMPESKIEKIEFLPNQSSRYKGSLKNTVFKNETGGIDALVALKKTGTAAFIKLPLNEAGQSVFVKFMQEGDRLGTGKAFMLTHPDKMFAKSPVKLAEVKEGDTVFEGVLTPVK